MDPVQVITTYLIVSVIAGIATFLLYDLAPLALLLYLMSTPQRRRDRRKREALAAAQVQAVDDEASLAPDEAKPQAPG